MNLKPAVESLYGDMWNEIQAWPIPPQRVELIGSSAYLSEWNDVDIMIKVYDVGSYLEQCRIKGFIGSPNQIEYPGEWTSLRRGQINLLITEDQKYFDDSLLAAKICQTLELKTRRERVMVHRVIVDHFELDEARKTTEEI